MVVAERDGFDLGTKDTPAFRTLPADGTVAHEYIGNKPPHNRLRISHSRLASLRGTNYDPLLTLAIGFSAYAPTARMEDDPLCEMKPAETAATGFVIADFLLLRKRPNTYQGQSQLWAAPRQNAVVYPQKPTPAETWIAVALHPCCT